jgi:hypothetical protein
VVESVGDHRLDDAKIVDCRGEVRQQFRQLGVALAVLSELELRSQELGLRIDEGGTVAFEQFGRRQLAVEPCQFWLVVEQFHVARPAAHEQEDDVLRLRGKVRLLRGERIVLCRGGGGRAQ